MIMNGVESPEESVNVQTNATIETTIPTNQARPLPMRAERITHSGIPNAPAAKYAIRKCADSCGALITSSIKNSTSVAGIDAAIPLKMKMISSCLKSGLLSGFHMARSASLVAASVRAMARGENITVTATIKNSSGTNNVANAAKPSRGPLCFESISGSAAARNTPIRPSPSRQDVTRVRSTG